MLGGCTPSKRRWRSLYKRPAKNRSSDLQWRIVHGAIATNRYISKIDPGSSELCPFCPKTETTEHLFMECHRLCNMFNFIGLLFQKLGKKFSFIDFIYGPPYTVKDRAVHVLLNFMSGQAKLATWLSRKRMIKDGISDDVVVVMKRLIQTRLKIEFEYHKVTNKLERFIEEWCVEGALATVEGDKLIFTF